LSSDWRFTGEQQKRLFDLLLEQSLVERKFFGNGQTKYAVLRLTDNGVVFAAELGYPIQKSE